MALTNNNNTRKIWLRFLSSAIACLHRGSHFVFHTASPFFITGVTDPIKQLVDPALKGTENVMGACIKAKATLKRVVLTSSIAAMRSSATPAPPVNPPLYGEHDWNEVRPGFFT